MTLVIAVLAMTLSTVAGAAAAPAVPSAPEAERQASDLPTAAEVRGRTEGLLDRYAGGRGERGGRARRGPIPVPPPPATPILPTNRVVSLYGAPQLTKTIVGRKSPAGAARKLVRQADAYVGEKWRPVVRAIDLVATIATASRGPDRRYRTRQDPAVIATYLEAARSVGARLMLDIQPGRSSFLAEVRAHEDWLLQPDVDVALDPEWNVGRRGVPGRTPGSVTARKVNRVSLRLQRTIEEAGLPPKLLVVHQFRRKSVRQHRRLIERPGVELVLNFDGIGRPRAKESGYGELSAEQLFNGFSLFYRRDRPLMTPARVVDLLPEPDLVLYQ